MREWADDGSFDTRLEWDRTLRLTYITDALGQETRYYSDIRGYPTRIVHPDQLEEWFFWDTAKNLTRHIHTDGTVDTYRYDVHGRLVNHVRPDWSALNYEYNDSHRLTRILDADENLWTRDHDPQGRLAEETDPLGNKTRYTYDAAGRPSTVIDAQGGRQTFAYTDRGQLASHTDCSNRTTQWRYDVRGRLIEHIDAENHSTRYTYTAVDERSLHAALAPFRRLPHANEPPNIARPYAEHGVPIPWQDGNWPGHLERIFQADGQFEGLRHDAEGRLLTHFDPRQRTTQYQYTPAGLVKRRIDALGQTLDYEWDALGRLTELRNENGQPYRFRHDPVGRLLAETGFDGCTTEYRYASMTGTLTEVVDGEVTTRLEFDPMGRLEQRQSVIAGGEPQTERFGYYKNGAIGEARNAHVRQLFIYDAAGNLTREHHEYLAVGRTAVWRHRYDALNQRTGTTRPDGHTVDWLTYGSGHVHGLLLDGEERVAFERDALHREIKRTQCNGLTQARIYDVVGRLHEQQLVHRDYDGPVESGAEPFRHRHAPNVGFPANLLRRYHYDPSGQLELISDTLRGSLRYGYDPLGRLLNADYGLEYEREFFIYDPAGNVFPVTKEVAQRAADRGPHRVPAPKLLDNLLRELHAVRYKYDQRGNLIERNRYGIPNQFEWDGFNRLDPRHHPRRHHPLRLRPLRPPHRQAHRTSRQPSQPTRPRDLLRLGRRHARLRKQRARRHHPLRLRAAQLRAHAPSQVTRLHRPPAHHRPPSAPRRQLRPRRTRAGPTLERRTRPRAGAFQAGRHHLLPM